jgi:ZIP family zinc transporter
VSQERTLLLGVIAGSTILLGLPLGRLRRPRPALSQFLNSVAVGILLFLVWDVLAHAWEPVDAALGNLHDDTGGFGPVVGYGSLFLGGIAVGLLSLVYYERWLARRGTGRTQSVGAMAAVETSETAARRAWHTPAGRLALLIAVGIGLHNFGEGLAIGQSAAAGEIGLATVLVIGFALHNGTEGFGIVAPLAADGERPPWAFLLTMGLIAGGPTVVGTAVGRQFTSAATSVAFLSLAAGSILYVVVQLFAVALRFERRSLLYWGLLVGLAAGFLTDMVVTAGGA